MTIYRETGRARDSKRSSGPGIQFVCIMTLLMIQVYVIRFCPVSFCSTSIDGVPPLLNYTVLTPRLCDHRLPDRRRTRGPDHYIDTFSEGDTRRRTGRPMVIFFVGSCRNGCSPTTERNRPDPRPRHSAGPCDKQYCRMRSRLEPVFARFRHIPQRNVQLFE